MTNSQVMLLLLVPRLDFGLGAGLGQRSSTEGLPVPGRPACRVNPVSVVMCVSAVLFVGAGAGSSRHKVGLHQKKMQN